jgi:uncharacterized protein (TIGR02145 family)
MNAPRRFTLASVFAVLGSACSAQSGPLGQTEADQSVEAAADAAREGASDGGLDTRADGGETESGAAPFVDPRDGKSYRTLRLGGARWLAQNLDHETAGSFCYDDAPESCERDGRLYTWSAAQAACPPGWHLGSDDDWKALEAALGMSVADLDREGYGTPRGTDQGRTLRAPDGFNATPAGYRAGVTYDARDDRTYFWTSTTRGADVWRRRITRSADGVFRFTNPPASFAISVRCVEDPE